MSVWSGPILRDPCRDRKQAISMSSFFFSLPFVCSFYQYSYVLAGPNIEIPTRLASERRAWMSLHLAGYLL